jgi:hypothetical protein
MIKLQNMKKYYEIIVLIGIDVDGFELIKIGEHEVI